MEFLQGEPLDVRLERETKLPACEVIRIGKETCLGLGVAHEKGLIHRDIKPANLWIEKKNDRVKILDFGLARATADATNLTQSGAIIGTPAYMAPEQARAEPVDHRGDLFSLGCVLYRLASGEMPFKGTTTISILAALALDTPKPLHEVCPDLPRDLCDLVMKLLAKQPADRPASAEQVVRALEGIKTDGSAAGVQATVPVKKAMRPAPSPTLTSGGKADRRTITAPIALPSKRRRKRGAAKTGVFPLLWPKTWRGRAPLLVGLGLLVLAPLALWLAVTMLRVETPNGTLLVELNGAEAEARVRDGKLILTAADGKDRYTLSPRQHDNKIEAGPYKIRVEGSDGLALDTTDFTLKKDDMVTVHVTAVPRAAATSTDATVKSGDPDREAAEWVLSLGGLVHVNGEVHQIKAVADLPPGSFWLTEVWFSENTPINDASLARLKDCKNLTTLGLPKTKVGDAGLANFKDRKTLTHIDLQDTLVTDTGLAYFKDCQNMEILWLSRANVSDMGMANFKDCKNLKFLALDGTKVSDAGLANFKDCENLRGLYLGDAKASDVGLANFKGCVNLWHLSLAGTQVTDMGLSPFIGCKDLKTLNVRGTKVSAAKVMEFKKALPICKIEWDDGVIQPMATPDPDREAAEWVLSIGGTVGVNEENRERKTVADLPPGVFRLMGVWASGKEQVNDTALARFKDCKNLRHIDLSETHISNSGLAFFKGCQNLTSIDLWHTQVSDAGLANFKDCKELTSLWLQETQVSDAGLAYFKDCKNLTDLRLWNTQISDVGLSYFMDCEKLTCLHLGNTHVTDAGLAPSKNYKNLTDLYLNGTRLNDRGLAHFKECKNLTLLDLGGVAVSDLGLINFKDCNNLTSLNLWNTRVSDGGLAVFKDCKNLTVLDLTGTKVSNAGLAHFKDCKNLNELHLDNTKITNAGLAHFKDCKNLTILTLTGDQVSNAGLTPFKSCTNLTTLNLRKTNVTAAEIVELRKSLPKCKIEWEGGVVEPTGLNLKSESSPLARVFSFR